MHLHAQTPANRSLEQTHNGVAPRSAVWTASLSAAAGTTDAAALLAAQRQSMQPLSIFDGAWRGPAKAVGADGKEINITQTERVGALLDGTIKFIEGRG